MVRDDVVCYLESAGGLVDWIEHSLAYSLRSIVLIVIVMVLVELKLG